MKKYKKYIILFLLLVFVLVLVLLSRSDDNTQTTSKNMNPKVPMEKPKVLIEEKPSEIEFLQDEYNNEDVIGRIVIPNTGIDYPIVQSIDNDFYLTRNPYKQDDINGSIYMDYENEIDRGDKNTIIYGHNMNRDVMFHSLRKYKDQSFYDNNPYFIIKSENQTKVYRIFSVANTDTSFPYNVVFTDIPFYDEYYQDLLYELQKISLYDTNTQVSIDEKIVILSTCTNTSDEERFIVSGKEYKTYTEEFSIELVIEDLNKNAQK